MHYPDHLLKLISLFKKLPGIGSKSAERFAFHLLEWPEDKLREMGGAIASIKEQIRCCKECGCLLETECPFCSNSFRDQAIICVVASPKDVFLVEQTRAFSGLYHILGALISPIQGLSFSSCALNKLKERAEKLQAKEIILAIDSTLEGDATALYLKKELLPLNVTISRLALGLPMGSPLDFIDGGTLERALAGRHSY